MGQRPSHFRLCFSSLPDQTNDCLSRDLNEQLSRILGPRFTQHIMSKLDSLHNNFFPTAGKNCPLRLVDHT
jgi:hypothetical protein